MCWKTPNCRSSEETVIRLSRFSASRVSFLVISRISLRESSLKRLSLRYSSRSVQSWSCSTRRLIRALRSFASRFWMRLRVLISRRTASVASPFWSVARRKASMKSSSDFSKFFSSNSTRPDSSASPRSNGLSCRAIRISS